MTLAIDLRPHHTDDFVTATGGVRSHEEPAAPGGAPVSTIDIGDLGDVSGGIVDGTSPFPLPRPDGLPLPPTLPRQVPPIPLGPFDPSSPKPAAA